MDAEGNRYGPYDIEMPGSEAEAYTEEAWFDLNGHLTGVMSGGALTFAGLTATLAAIDVRVHGSYLIREDPWSAASTPTSTSSPRRDLLVARRQLTSGEGEAAIPGKTFLVVLPGTPAATPVDPAHDPVTDERLWSWRVPGSGGTVVTDIRDLRRWQSQSLSGTPIAASLGNSGGTALAAGGWTTLPLHVEDVDTHDGHSSGDNTRWYAPATKLYVVSAQVSFIQSSVSSLSYRGARIRKNGAVVPRLAARLPVAANGLASIPIPATPVLLAAGEYLDLQAFHNSGGAMTTHSDAEYFTSLNVFAL